MDYSPNNNSLWAKFLDEGLPFRLFVGIALIGGAVWWTWNTVAEWQEKKSILNWQVVQCQVIESRIDKGKGFKKSDLFVVHYRYKYNKQEYESNSYQKDYDGDSRYYPKAQELLNTYGPGEKISCSVNPDDPKQAVLYREKPFLATYLIIPAFFLILGLRQIARGYLIFFKDESPDKYKDTSSMTTWQKANHYFWKWTTNIALCLSLLLCFWAVVVLGTLFILLPFLFVGVIGTLFHKTGKQLLKEQPVETPSGPDYSKKSKKLHLTQTERLIIAAALAVYIVIQISWARHILSQQTPRDQQYISIFLILFTAFWTFFLTSMITFGIISGLRYIRKERFRRAQLSEAEKLAETFNKKDWRYFLSDLSVWSLLLSNLITIAWALIEGWSISLILWIYWTQSIIIGIFWSIRIFRLRDFSTKDFDINVHLTKPTKVIKIKPGVFFLFHYNFFHFIYALFLLSEMKSRPTWPIALAGGIFLLNQLFTLWYKKQQEQEKRPNLGKLMAYPYARIIPMHFTIIAAAILHDKLGLSFESSVTLVIFLLIKTLADVVMYLSQQRGFADKPDEEPDKYEMDEKIREDFRELTQINCRCSQIDSLLGAEARKYAKKHLKAVRWIEGGWKIEYLCPETGKRWIKEEINDANKNKNPEDRITLRTLTEDDKETNPGIQTQANPKKHEKRLEKRSHLVYGIASCNKLLLAANQKYIERLRTR